MATKDHVVINCTTNQVVRNIQCSVDDEGPRNCKQFSSSGKFTMYTH